MSASGTCYGMRETSANGTYYISDLGTCTGDAASTDAPRFAASPNRRRFVDTKGRSSDRPF